MARRRRKCREVVGPRIILLSQGKADSNNALGRRSIQEIGRKRVRQSASKSVAEDRLPYDGRWIRRWSYKARGVKELYCTSGILVSCVSVRGINVLIIKKKKKKKILYHRQLS